MATDKITNPHKLRHWPYPMETDYVYTLGVAGERFFKEIKEKGRIMGAKCKRCNLVYLPPKLYCERCFDKLEQWVDVGTKGEVYTYTIVHYDENGKKLEKPVVYAFIKINGTHGGIIHKLGDIAPEDVEIGIPVVAVFKPKNQRESTISDIKHFKPAK